MNLNINEIFYSLQGEGAYAGAPVIFIRLSGCNLACDFCDTRHQIGTEMSLEDIFKGIIHWPSMILVITGGEPTLQWTRECYDYFKGRGYRIHIETNGTSEDVFADWVTVSPKPSADYRILCRADEIKIVWNGTQGQIARQMIGYKKAIQWLMPMDNADQHIKTAITYCKEHPTWRLAYRIQTALKLR